MMSISLKIPATMIVMSIFLSTILQVQSFQSYPSTISTTQRSSIDTSSNTKRSTSIYSTTDHNDMLFGISATDVFSDDWIAKDLVSQLDNESNEHAVSSNEQAIDTNCNNVVRGPKQALIYDTTLRDGTQMESISASCDDKLKITQRLSKFNVDYIEAGWPGSNPKDEEFFTRAKVE